MEGVRKAVGGGMGFVAATPTRFEVLPNGTSPDLPRAAQDLRKNPQYMVRSKLTSCKKCLEVCGRSVQYCSRGCQKADWWQHKLVCGKEIVLPA